MVKDKELKQVSPNSVTRVTSPKLSRRESQFFVRCLNALNQAGIPYVIGGAFASHVHTGIWRNTKDLDVFLRPEDVKAAMKALSKAGLKVGIKARHWLAKAWKDIYFVDLIYAMGNGQYQVDDVTLETSIPAKICGVKVGVMSLEELMASKVYIAKRDRFDGADVIHLIHAAKGKIHWNRLLDRLGEHREILLWHLVLFNYVYPTKADYLPDALMVKLFEESRRNWAKYTNAKIFRGTLLDELAFCVDVKDWGYHEPRKLNVSLSKKQQPR